MFHNPSIGLKDLMMAGERRKGRPKSYVNVQYYFSLWNLAMENEFWFHIVILYWWAYWYYWVMWGLIFFTVWSWTGKLYLSFVSDKAVDKGWNKQSGGSLQTLLLFKKSLITTLPDGCRWTCRQKYKHDIGRGIKVGADIKTGRNAMPADRCHCGFLLPIGFSPLFKPLHLLSCSGCFSTRTQYPDDLIADPVLWFL